MELFYVGDFILCIIMVLLGIGLILLGLFLSARDYETASSISVTVGVIIISLFIIGLILDTVSLINQRSSEPIIYQEMIAEGHSLEKALERSGDIINTDLYTRAVNWNVELAKIQAAEKDPKYAISFTGAVDWSTVDPIVFS